MDQKLFDALQNVLNKYFLNNKKFDIANSINFENKATIFLKDIQEISVDIIEQNLQYGVELFLTQQVLQSKNYIDWVRGGNILRGA